MNKILYTQLVLQGIIFLVGVILIPIIKSYFGGMKDDIKEIKENMVTEKLCDERRDNSEKLHNEKMDRVEKDLNGLGIRISNFLNGMVKG